jgi:hypothetical protein
MEKFDELNIAEILGMNNKDYWKWLLYDLLANKTLIATQILYWRLELIRRNKIKQELLEAIK